ncbi:cysteine-rich CWC family protein [Massilia sp. YIM B02763]|uniref:cysteine-rich CWC family protein n=1 Tax=Massilia sp. YIM B02763 TaxID=3050130 RepID=UPI0025B665EC|nr:cysteine-rich CWC family protein [Massilia sp. YIM B02763]MDN4053821.1 cysteine-rich CWC family protein [Massilia sp. YIM B02763]
MSTCARCGATFGCGMADPDGAGGEPCWCTRLPAVVPLPEPGQRSGCWCPACLEQHIALQGGTAPRTPA